MSIIEVAETTAVIRRAPRVIKPRELTLDPDVCMKMAADYNLLCIKRPFVNRCMAAFTVCTSSFPELDLKTHPKKMPMVELRQQLMAFCRVISADRQANSWKAIARAFNCRHGTVINAHRVYGSAMEKMLRHG